jgi:DNA-directed RNA polymerase specialized sigma24 family protein
MYSASMSGPSSRTSSGCSATGTMLRNLLRRRSHERALVPEVDYALRLDIERAFAKLDRDDRELLMLVDFLGFTPSAAAALMDIDPHTLRMRLHRARARLRTRLEVVTP